MTAKTKTLLTLLLAAAPLASCKGKEDSGAAGSGAAGSGAAGSGSAGSGSAGSGSAGVGADAAGAAGSGSASPASSLEAREVRALVERWLAAQNAGDFAAYQALYAARMEGVKRVAARTWRFDRKGWLEDRARMFERPMQVEISAVSVASSGPAAAVELEQRFTQGKFRDAGPKRLIVVQEGGALRIAREEMLRSEVEGADASTGQGGVLLVGTLLGARHVYLQLEADPAWGSGPLRGPVEGDPLLATRAAGHAPPAYAAWRGREVVAYAADGTRCKAVVGELQLVAGGTPHFGVIQEWNGHADGELDRQGPVTPPAERAAYLFSLGRPHLVGELEVEGSCAPVVVLDRAADAVVAPVAAPVFYPPHEADPAELAVVLRAFRALPAYRALQREWQAEFDGQGEWSRTPFVRIFDRPAGQPAGPRYFAVSDGGPGCAEFGGSLSALFVERAGKLAPLRLDAGRFTPAALFDSDGDGQLEAVDPGAGHGSYDSYLRVADGVLTPVQWVEYPFGDCGC